MSERWTVRRVVSWIAEDLARREVATARLDAELIVAHALGIDRVGVYLDLERPLSPAELAAIRSLVERRRGAEPIAYIVGSREFYGRRFQVTKDVLVPRPETELVVERSLAFAPDDGTPRRALDLATGSGAIGLTLALERTALSVDLTDISPAAIGIARTNAAALGVDETRARFLEGNLFGPVERETYDLVVSNPPYIPTAEVASLPRDVRDHEPHLALDGGADGLDFVRRIAAGARTTLRPGGALIVEVGAGQGADTVEIFSAAGLVEARAHQDLRGIERVVEARQPAS